MHLQIFYIGGYHTTSHVSITRKSVTFEKNLWTLLLWNTWFVPKNFWTSLALTCPDFLPTAHLLDSMTSFLKKPMVEATPRDLETQDCPFQWISPQKIFGRQPPNIPIGCCSREASCWVFTRKMEDLGCVLQTHSTKSHPTVESARGAREHLKSFFPISSHGFPRFSRVPAYHPLLSMSTPCSPVSSCRPWKCEFELW